MKINQRKLNTGIKIGLLFGIFFVFLTYPSFAEGAIPDFINHGITKIMGWLGPIIGAWVLAFFTLAIGTVALYISTSLLQWVIDISPEALTVLTGDAAPIIQVGWNFTAGITNMLLLIAFIAIAISIILGSDSFDLKKSLPRLILVAFLVNFSLLFVGAGIDISNILFNSVANRFSEDGGNILYNAIVPLFDITNQFISFFLKTIIGIAIISFIPVKGAVAAVAQLVAFPFLFPQIIQWLFIGIILISMSLLFFSFFAILLMRIFIIQVLAILSPLAFFCRIFPDTKKWWDLWLKHFIEWLFVGVAFIFFIYLGLALAPLPMNISQPVIEESPSWIAWFFDYTEIVSYIILLVYFSVIFFLVRQFVPALANTAISSVKGAIQVASPYVDAWSKGSSKNLQKISKESPTLQNAGKAMEGFSAEGPVGRPFSKWARGTGRALRAEHIDKKEVNDRTKELEDNNNYAEMEEALRTGDDNEVMASLLAAEKTGKIGDLVKNYEKDITSYINKGLLAKAKAIDKDSAIIKATGPAYLKTIEGDKAKMEEFRQDYLSDKNAKGIVKSAAAGNTASQELVKTVIDKDSVKHFDLLGKEGGKAFADTLAKIYGKDSQKMREKFEESSHRIVDAIDRSIIKEAGGLPSTQNTSRGGSYSSRDSKSSSQKPLPDRDDTNKKDTGKGPGGFSTK